MVTQTEKDAFSQRLNNLLDDVGFPAKGAGRQIELAKRYDVTQKGARKWLEGESIPTMIRLSKIAADFGCDIQWLLSGVQSESSAPANSEGGQLNFSTAVKDKKLAKELWRFRSLIESDAISADLLRSFLDTVEKANSGKT